jgi:hypothetical protein
MQQTYHFREITHPVPGGLDLNIADDEEFSPDKLRANMERLYMTVIIGMMGFGKHIARLRSWRESRRTTYFCAVCYPLSVQFLISLTVIGLLFRLDFRSPYPSARMRHARFNRLSRSP